MNQTKKQLINDSCRLTTPLAIAITSFMLLTAGCAISGSDTSIPAQLKPADSQALVMKLPAIGVQIYECKSVDGKPAQWTFVAPEADLFEMPGMTLVGKHDAGPHWQLADGSRVKGKVVTRADATNVGAIPSLLLSAQSVGSAGRLDKVTTIQRRNTVGGVAPSTGCSATETGKQARVYYTADYYFYANK
jgi:hypothetical protein